MYITFIAHFIKAYVNPSIYFLFSTLLSSDSLIPSLISTKPISFKKPSGLSSNFNILYCILCGWIKGFNSPQYTLPLILFSTLLKHLNVFEKGYNTASCMICKSFQIHNLHINILMYQSILKI